jgi:hypothetical protein
MATPSDPAAQMIVGAVSRVKTLNSSAVALRTFSRREGEFQGIVFWGKTE